PRRRRDRRGRLHGPARARHRHNGRAAAARDGRPLRPQRPGGDRALPPPHDRDAGGASLMSDWHLAYEGFDPRQEGLREALCTLGNGYFATRGAAEEAEADEIHYPGTYLAGGYNRLKTEIAGRTIENEDLVNLPNWLPLSFRPEDGDWLNLLAMEIVTSRQELDMRRGVLVRELRVRDRQGRETSLTSRRLVHMSDPHLAAIEWVLTPENWSGRIVVRSAL